MQKYSMKHNQGKTVTIVSPDGRTFEMPNRKGWEIVRALVQSPNTEIPTLSLMIDRLPNKDVPPDFFEESMAYCEISLGENPVPKSDQQSIDEVKNELNKVITEIASLENEEFKDEAQKTSAEKRLSGLREKLKNLGDYLKKVYNPYRGVIRDFPTLQSRAKSAAYAAIRRLCIELEEQDKVLADFLKKSIRIGRFSIYEPIKETNILITFTG